MTGSPSGAQPSMPTLAFTVQFDGLSRQLISDAFVIAFGKEAPTRALWDTGASRTCIADEIAHALGLEPSGMMEIRTPSGKGTVGTYLVDIGLPNQVKIEGVPVCGSRIGEQGIGVLVGMDIISLGDLAVSSFGEKTCFSFRMPSKAKTDYVREEKIEMVIGQRHGPGKGRKRKK